MKTKMSFLFAVLLLPAFLVAQPLPTLEGVYHLNWRVSFLRYEGLLVMDGTSGKLRVRYYNPEVKESKIVEMRMQFQRTAQGDILAGHDPVDASTERPLLTYSPDNFVFEWLPDGTFQVTNIDDNGVQAAIQMAVVEDIKDRSQLLKTFGWKFQQQQAPVKTALEWYEYGLSLEEEGQHAEAVEAFNQVIQTPDVTQDVCIACTWAHRGLNLEQVGDYKNAILSYTNALRINPDIEFARRNRAKLWKIHGYIE